MNVNIDIIDFKKHNLVHVSYTSSTMYLSTMYCVHLRVIVYYLILVIQQTCNSNNY